MSVYRRPTEPFIPGALRTKTWRSLEPNLSQDDKRWQARCSQYWSLQARLYGIRFSSFAMIVDNNEGFVSTYAAVLEVLPGERTDDFSRVPIEAAQIPSVA